MSNTDSRKRKQLDNISPTPAPSATAAADEATQSSTTTTTTAPAKKTRKNKLPLPLPPLAPGTETAAEAATALLESIKAQYVMRRQETRRMDREMQEHYDALIERLHRYSQRAFEQQALVFRLESTNEMLTSDLAAARSDLAAARSQIEPLTFDLAAAKAYIDRLLKRGTK